MAHSRDCPPADPNPGVCSSRRENQRPPHQRLILFCPFCLPCSPRRGLRAAGLRLVRCPGERGEPGRFTAPATSAHAADVNTTLPSRCGQRPRWRVDTSGHRPQLLQQSQPASPPAAPADRPDGRSGLGAQRETGTQDGSLLGETALLPLLGPGRGHRGTGQGRGSMWPSPCTGLTRSPQNPRPPRTSERYTKLRFWLMALVRMRSCVTEGER